MKQQSADVKTYMSVTAALCIILAFGYFWYFPFYISNAISYLSKRITELLGKAGIASDIKTNDETYVILQSIELIEKKFGIDNSEKDSL